MLIPVLVVGIILLIILFAYIAFYFRTKPILKRQLPTSSEETYQIPQSYSTGRLVAMVKNPYWIYAYWDLNPSQKQKFTSQYGKDAWERSRPTLRVYDLTGVESYTETKAPYFDLFIDDLANNWYIRVGKPRSTFYLELGRKFADGLFVPLLRSNRVTTPADSISSEIDPQWPPLEELWKSVYKAKGIPVPGSPQLRQERND
ncbi:DUF4912 domain-containing protein [Calderihabitans maritimus]|uniref:DUF4912 domain-containing protein n=1 Tax=Calderihabitans maritimus TaxID=1246530 RepID=A0A1Z5HPW7_9FIRM|nr:DUF4912 domain-containing protein [Calderihabitans maritimus]GAW91579.1 hypothetical protein Moth_1914 [Calderihabitans maritimus]